MLTGTPRIRDKQGGGGGLTFVTHDGTLIGDGTPANPLGVAPAYVPPGASLSASNPIREKGSSIACNLSWTATKHSDTITAITVDTIPQVPTGNTQSGVQAGTLVQDVDKTFSMSVTDAHPTTVNASATVVWELKKYVGVDAATTLNEAGIEALSISNALATSLSGTYVFPGSTTYKYFCCPDYFSAPAPVNGFKDASNNLNISMADSGDDIFYNNIDANGWYYGVVSVTNATATPVTQNYRVYRTKYTLTGAITIIVS